MAIDVLGGGAGIRSSSGQGQPASAAGRWFPPFSRMIFMFWNNLLMMIFYYILVNDEMTMKCLIEFLMIVEMTMKYRLGFCWILKQWWKC